MCADGEVCVLWIGSCQFPTLGFVVDRYHKIKNFVAEPFWYIKVMQKRDDIHVTFNWNRSRLFDRMSTVILFERCLLEKYATVISTVSKPARKLYLSASFVFLSRGLADGCVGSRCH